MKARIPVICAVCFGSPDSLASKAVWNGVFLLMAVVVSVLTVIACTAFVWARRARELEHAR